MTLLPLKQARQALIELISSGDYCEARHHDCGACACDEICQFMGRVWGLDQKAPEAKPKTDDERYAWFRGGVDEDLVREIKKLHVQPEPERCPRCDGSGEVESHYGGPMACPRCGGNGWMADHPKGGVMPGQGLASALFESDRLKERCLAVIYYSLSSDFRDHAADRELEPEVDRLDHYDSSIEWIAEPGAVLCEMDLTCLAVLGFRRCWVKYRDKSPETYYACQLEPKKETPNG